MCGKIRLGKTTGRMAHHSLGSCRRNIGFTLLAKGGTSLPYPCCFFPSQGSFITVTHLAPPNLHSFPRDECTWMSLKERTGNAQPSSWVHPFLLRASLPTESKRFSPLLSCGKRSLPQQRRAAGFQVQLCLDVVDDSKHWWQCIPGTVSSPVKESIQLLRADS